MTKYRQPLGPDHPGEDRNAARPVVALVSEVAHRGGFPWHRHYRAQLVFAAQGVVTVSASEGTWLVPPEQAVWVPAGALHQVDSPGPFSLRSLYVHPTVCDGLPPDTCVLRVSPLLREVMGRLVSLPTAYGPAGRAARLAAVIPDELRLLRPEPLHLPLPTARRLRVVTDGLIANPADARSLADWAREAGASERTLARLFQRKTGMTFGAWRQRLRLVRAVERLAEGAAVTDLALDLGYDSPSAFIVMFRRELGTTPGRYLGSTNA